MQQMEQPIGGVVKCLSNQIRRHLDAAASEAGAAAASKRGAAA